LSVPLVGFLRLNLAVLLQCRLCSCQVIECEEEAVVGMDTAHLTINSSLLQNCKGPGVDLSGSAAASINGSKIEQCVGGVWLWDAASAVIRGATLGGGPSHAILADSGAALQVRVSLHGAHWPVAAVIGAH
jgi:hypothetical protein